MGARSRSPNPPSTPAIDDDSDAAAISHYRTRPGRYVFIEQDNTDGWIATDVTVKPEA